jgi:hypothetical protein
MTAYRLPGGRLTRSVGQGGANVPADVRYVQFLLSDWLLGEGKEALKVDGKCGPLTNKAIIAFQADHTQHRDGRLDPGGPTIRALERIHQAALGLPLIHLAPVFYAPAAARRGRELQVADLEALFEHYLLSLRQDFDT